MTRDIIATTRQAVAIDRLRRRLTRINDTLSQASEGVPAAEIIPGVLRVAAEARREIEQMRALQLADLDASMEAHGASWDGRDIDDLVDDLARAGAPPARARDIQKFAVDDLTRHIIEGTSRDPGAVGELVDRLYYRFLLAGDVGFELGFNAARLLSTGR